MPKINLLSPRHLASERVICRWDLEPDDDHITWRGFTMLEGDAFWARLLYFPTFKRREEWCREPYRFVWVCEPELAILTYCEGDITLTRDRVWGRFYGRLLEAKRFYEEEKGEVTCSGCGFDHAPGHKVKLSTLKRDQITKRLALAARAWLN